MENKHGDFVGEGICDCWCGNDAEMCCDWVGDWHKCHVRKQYLHEKREWKKELRDMSKCPDCGKIQHPHRKEPLEECQEFGCDSCVVMYRGNLEWRNENWG